MGHEHGCCREAALGSLDPCDRKCANPGRRVLFFDASVSAGPTRQPVLTIGAGSGVSRLGNRWGSSDL